MFCFFGGVLSKSKHWRLIGFSSGEGLNEAMLALEKSDGRTRLDHPQKGFCVVFGVAKNCVFEKFLGDVGIIPPRKTCEFWLAQRRVLKFCRLNGAKSQTKLSKNLPKRSLEALAVQAGSERPPQLESYRPCWSPLVDFWDLLLKPVQVD